MQQSFEVDGQRLRQLRVHRALSLRALKERSGVAYDTINKLENGHRPARLVTIRKLAEALGVEPKELIPLHGSDAYGAQAQDPIWQNPA